MPILSYSLTVVFVGSWPRDHQAEQLVVKGLAGICLLLCSPVYMTMMGSAYLLANGGYFLTVKKQKAELCVMLPLS